MPSSVASEVIPLHCRTTNRSREHKLLQYHLSASKPLHKLSNLVIKRLKIEDLLEPVKAVKDIEEKSLFLAKLEEQRQDDVKCCAVYWLIRASIESHQKNYVNAVKMFENAFAFAKNQQEVDTLVQKRDQFAGTLRKRDHGALAVQLMTNTSQVAMMHVEQENSAPASQLEGKMQQFSSAQQDSSTTSKRKHVNPVVTPISSDHDSGNVLKPLHNIQPLNRHLQHLESFNKKSVESIVKSQMMTPEVVRLNREARRKQRLAALPRAPLFSSPQNNIVILETQRNKSPLEMLENEVRRQSLSIRRMTLCPQEMRENQHAVRRESILLGHSLTEKQKVIEHVQVEKVIPAVDKVDGESSMLSDLPRTPLRNVSESRVNASAFVAPQAPEDTKRQSITMEAPLATPEKTQSAPANDTTITPYIDRSSDDCIDAHSTPGSDYSSHMMDDPQTPLHSNATSIMMDTPHFTPVKNTPLSKPAQRVAPSPVTQQPQSEKKMGALFARPQRLRRDQPSQQSSTKKRRNPAQARFAQDSDDDEDEIPAHILAHVTPSKQRQRTPKRPSASGNNVTVTPLTSPFNFSAFTQNTGWTPKPATTTTAQRPRTPSMGEAFKVKRARTPQEEKRPQVSPEKTAQISSKRNLFGTPADWKEHETDLNDSDHPLDDADLYKAVKLPFQSPSRRVMHVPRQRGASVNTANNAAVTAAANAMIDDDEYVQSDLQTELLMSHQILSQDGFDQSQEELPTPMDEEEEDMMDASSPTKPEEEALAAPLSTTLNPTPRAFYLNPTVVDFTPITLHRDAELRAEILAATPATMDASFADDVEVVIFQPPVAPLTRFQIRQRAREFVYLRQVKQLRTGQMVELAPYLRAGAAKNGSSRRGKRREKFSF